jgi:hypothetical protein
VTAVLPSKVTVKKARSVVLGLEVFAELCIVWVRDASGSQGGPRSFQYQPQPSIGSVGSVGSVRFARRLSSAFDCLITFLFAHFQS